MSIMEYKGAHSIAFWDFTTGTRLPKFSWDDFHLIPKSRPYIALPEVNISIVNVPQTNVYLNITSSAPGGKTYKGRVGQWDFIIDHTQYSSWTKSFKKIKKYFHGKRLYVSLLEEPTNIYSGRFEIEYNPESDYTSMTIKYNLDTESIYDTIKNDIYFRVRFLDDEGNVLQSSYEPYGSIYFYTNNQTDEYVVKGFSDVVTQTTGNKDYIVYRKRIETPHPVRFVSLEDEAIYTENILPKNVNAVKRS